MRWHVLAWSALTLGWLAPSAPLCRRAQAQESGAAELPAVADDAPEGGESPAYKSAIDGALVEYRLQHFTEARSLFARAHAIDPSARTLRGLGMVEFELRHYVVAHRLLDASLESTTKPLTAAQRSAVQELLARTRQFISRYVLDVQPPGANPSVELDGKRVELDAEHGFSVESGEHTLRVSAARVVELALDAKGGEVQTLRIELPPEEAKSGPTAKAAAEPVSAAAQRKKRVALGLTVAGGAVLVGSGVLGALALVKAHDVSSQDSPGADRAHTLGIATDVMISVGVATAITGVVLLISQRRRARVDSSEARLEAGARARERSVDLSWPNLRVSF